MADTPDGSPDAAPDRAVARARLRRKRIALVAVTAVALAFITLSCLQIIPAVFGAWVRPLPQASPGSNERICAEGVRRLAQALDRAKGMAGGPGFDQALRPDWNIAFATQQACAHSPEGLDAWASLVRLRSAEEQLAGRAGDPLGPLQRQVASHLPVDLR
jgi:hypothetical protein